MTEDTGPGHSSGFQSSPATPRLIEGLPADLHEGAFDPFMDEDELEEMQSLVDTKSKRRVAPKAHSGSMDVIPAAPQAPEKNTLYKMEVDVPSSIQGLPLRDNWRPLKLDDSVY